MLHGGDPKAALRSLKNQLNDEISEMTRQLAEIDTMLGNEENRIYTGKDYRETNIFIEYAQSVDRIGKDTPTLKFKTLEPITAVSVEHHGSYENLTIRNIYQDTPVRNIAVISNEAGCEIQE